MCWLTIQQKFLSPCLFQDIRQFLGYRGLDTFTVYLKILCTYSRQTKNVRKLEYKILFTGSYSYRLVHFIHMNPWVKNNLCIWIQSPYTIICDLIIKHQFSIFWLPLSLQHNLYSNLAKCKFKQLYIYSEEFPPLFNLSEFQFWRKPSFLFYFFISHHS